MGQRRPVLPAAVVARWWWLLGGRLAVLLVLGLHREDREVALEHVEVEAAGRLPRVALADREPADLVPEGALAVAGLGGLLHDELLLSLGRHLRSPCVWAASVAALTRSWSGRCQPHEARRRGGC